MRFTARAATALASVAMAFAIAIPASAQEPAPPSPRAPDDVELRTFTESYIDIQDIQTATEAKVAAAATDEEKAQVQAAAEQEMEAVLTQRQLDRERFEEIANLLNTDPELKARFDELHAKVLEERKGGG